MRHLMVVLDRRRERQMALETAGLWAERLHLSLDVFLPMSIQEPDGLRLGAGLEESVKHTAVLEGEKWLSEHLQTEPVPVSVSSHVISCGHHWAEAVIHEARRTNAELIFVCRESAPDTASWKQLLRQLPCPTYVVHRGGMIRTLVAGVSAIAEDDAHKLLNDTILEYAARLRDLWGAKLRVASALPSPLEFAPLVGETYAVGYVEKELEASFRESLQELLAKHHIPAEDLCTSMGAAEGVLAQESESCSADCLVVGTVSRKALAAFLLGNSAEAIERKVSADVLLLRPQDYIEAIAEGDSSTLP